MRSAYAGFTNEPAIRLAEKLVSLAYDNMAAVYFTTGGAESNESAFKFARYHWKRLGKPNKVKIISRRYGYHGVTLAAMSATSLPNYHKMFGPHGATSSCRSHRPTRIVGPATAMPASGPRMLWRKPFWPRAPTRLPPSSPNR